MIERTGPQALEKISKKSKQFCDQIDSVQNEFIQKKNSLKIKD